MFLDRMRRVKIQLTWRCFRFKGIAGLVKGAKETTTNTMQTLCKI